MRECTRSRSQLSHEEEGSRAADKIHALVLFDSNLVFLGARARPLFAPRTTILPTWEEAPVLGGGGRIPTTPV